MFVSKMDSPHKVFVALLIGGFILIWYIQKRRRLSVISFETAAEWRTKAKKSLSPFVPNFRIEIPEEQELRNEDFSIRYDTWRYLEELQTRVDEVASASRSICPFVEPASKADYLKLALLRNVHCERDVIAVVRGGKKQFLLALREIDSPVKKSWLCFLLVFPEAKGELIHKIKHDLKQEFLDSGLMIGEFHQLNSTKSIRSDYFYPRRAGHPIIAIRLMIDNDINFLQINKEFIEAYLANFQGTSSANVNKAEKLYQSRK